MFYGSVCKFTLQTLRTQIFIYILFDIATHSNLISFELVGSHQRSNVSLICIYDIICCLSYYMLFQRLPAHIIYINRRNNWCFFNNMERLLSGFQQTCNTPTYDPIPIQIHFLCLFLYINYISWSEKIVNYYCVCDIKYI